MKNYLNHLNKSGITAASDGLLRDQIIRGKYVQAAISAKEAIARREREIAALVALGKMLEVADEVQG